MLKLNQVIGQHQSEVITLNFIKQSNQLISGDCHSNWIRCLILNNNEDLFISSSNDKTIKFWFKKNEWICQQTITDHSSQVYQLSLNDQQMQVISCGYDILILVIEQSEPNKYWNVKQKIQVDCKGYRLCFINDNLFAFQPENGNLISLNQKILQQIKERKVVYYFHNNLFNKNNQLLISMINMYILIRFTENAEFKVEQSIQFGTNYIYGQLSDDGEYMINWDQTSNEMQIRKLKEQ
ncbi:unnamed protein product [Paramecium pentaurelia]|uniref:Uncharacterized protein n=1 Tax=Paramecium pentaurelia TaxID=43138 RepID=A0A8S1YLT8_9CILI|nr:unnamed protein product [Paramecium pentaurelia]